MACTGSCHKLTRSQRTAGRDRGRHGYIQPASGKALRLILSEANVKLQAASGELPLPVKTPRAGERGIEALLETQAEFNNSSEVRHCQVTARGATPVGQVEPLRQSQSRGTLPSRGSSEDSESKVFKRLW